MSHLDTLVDQTRQRLTVRKEENPEVHLYEQIVIGDFDERFYRVFSGVRKESRPAIIAEIKFASPSAGTIASRDRLEEMIQVYTDNGASALSIVTEENSFQGSLADVTVAAGVTDLPILRKDFVIDTYQILETAVAQADALLLIASILDEKTLSQFVEMCFVHGIEPVVEVATKSQLDAATRTNARCIAVNARNLHDFTVDPEAACALGSLVPDDRVFLAFSGVSRPVDVGTYARAGAHGVLVGTALMKSENPAELLKQLTDADTRSE